MKFRRYFESVGALTLILSAGTVAAQEAEDGEGGYALDTITVTTTRTSQGRPLSSVPGSVTVIDREQIEEQSVVSNDFGEVLTNLVPGLGPSSQSLTNFGQQLRGRDMLILIDGVPQTTPLRDGAKSLRVIDPSAVERVEVIRGAVATYGYGATGGIINIITRSGGDEGIQYRTEVGVTGALDEGSDGLGGHIAQTVEGAKGDIDYALNLSAQTLGSFFDADGNRIAPDAFLQGGGLADSNEYNVQGKVGFQLTPNQRLRLSANYYRVTQYTDYITDSDGSDPAFAVEGDPPGENPGTENVSLTADYTVEDVWGGILSSQLYYQDYETLFSFFPGFGQTAIVSEKVGARLVHERSFIGRSNIVYGIDLLRDETGQPFVGGGNFAPRIEQFSYAPFAQLEVPVGQDWLVRGGVRYEDVRLDVDDFVTDTRTVEGGEIDYDETVFNLGAVYFLNNQQELFASFSQGFSVAEVGRIIRDTPVTSVEAADAEAQVVDNYEIGWRAYTDRVDASVSLFYNTSDLGTSFTEDLRILRQEEEIYGIEVTTDWRVADAWTLGGTASWQEGKADTDEDGNVDAFLPVTRISPPKLTAYGEYAPNEAWDARLQLTHFGDRDHDEYSAGFGGVDVDSYTLVDALVSVAAGPGRVRAGINNLLDEDYITPLGQVYGIAGAGGSLFQFVPGRGRTFSISYAIDY